MKYLRFGTPIETTRHFFSPESRGGSWLDTLKLWQATAAACAEAVTMDVFPPVSARHAKIKTNIRLFVAALTSQLEGRGDDCQVEPQLFVFNLACIRNQPALSLITGGLPLPRR